MSKYSTGTVVFGNWKIKGLIGNTEDLYEIVNADGISATMQVISIPNNPSEVDDMQAQGASAAEIKKHFYTIVENTVNTIGAAANLKGEPNVLAYEDFAVIERDDSLGWDILVRTEKVTPLSSKMAQMSAEDVIKMGIGISTALDACAKNGINHRAVKPENIMISANGEYKLGGFGEAAACTGSKAALLNSSEAMYAAPEVCNGCEPTDDSDIYSLGIILYQLFNQNRAPFLPLDRSYTAKERNTAINRRNSGEDLPTPVNAKGPISKIVLTACATNSVDRFSYANELKNALQSVLDNPGFASAYAGVSLGLANSDGFNSNAKAAATVVPPAKTEKPQETAKSVAQKSEPSSQMNIAKAEQPVTPPWAVVSEPEEKPAPMQAPPVAPPTPAWTQQNPNQHTAPSRKAVPKQDFKNRPLIIAIIAVFLVLGIAAIVMFIALGGNGEAAHTNAVTTTDATLTTTSEVTVATTTAAVTVENSLPNEKVLSDGSKEKYVYDENGNLIETVVEDPSGKVTARYKYSDGECVSEKRYDQNGQLVYELSVDGGIRTETVYNRDSEGNMIDGVIRVYGENGVITEERTLNKFGGVISTKYYENGGVISTRTYHFTKAGDDDGYTETVNGRSTRYNQDGSLRVEVTTTAATTTTTTTTTTATTADEPEPAPSNGTTTKIIQQSADEKIVQTILESTGAVLKQVTYKTIGGEDYEKEVINYTVSPRTKVTYNLDSNGKVYGTLYYEFNQNPSNYTTYIVRDGNGNITKHWSYERDDNGKELRTYIYDPASGELLYYIEHGASDIKYSPDGKYLGPA